MNWKLLGSALLYVSGALHVANAAVIIDLVQLGPDVVATATGTIDMSALGAGSDDSGGSLFIADHVEGTVLFVGSTDVVEGKTYWGKISSGSPLISTGSGGAYPTSGSGLVFGVLGPDTLFIASSYTSGDPIASSTTWANTSLADLGISVGTYVYTWGSSETADSLTINVSVSAVPEPGTTALLGVGGLGLFLARRLRRA